MNPSSTLLDAVSSSLRGAATHDAGVEEPPVVVLWTDPGKDWQPVIAHLIPLMPELLVLGDLRPEYRTGPVIWLKSVLAGRIPELSLPAGATPVLYLPGVARHHLRQADQCPWELQPLVELLYRGVAWTHRNGRDWTLEAFLQSEDGLHVDMAGDERTRLSLRAALTALAKTPVSALRGRRLDASDFDAIVVGDTKRDLLTWIGAGAAVKTEWGAERWHAFRSRCRDEFNLDPEKEPPLVAAEKLGRRESAWRGLWDRFCEAPALYLGVREALDRAQPVDQLALDAEPWPRVNEAQEDDLRAALLGLGNLAPHNSRQEITNLERQHAGRRHWVWARLGEAPLAVALESLHQLADLTRAVPAFDSVDTLVHWYREIGWKADAASLEALQVGGSLDNDPAVHAAIRSIYAPWLEECAVRMQEVLATSKYAIVPGIEAGEGECLVFVDGLRFDVGQMLGQFLEEAGLLVGHDMRLAALPTITPTAKPAVAPCSRMCHGNAVPPDFRPVQSDGREVNSATFTKLMANAGYECIDDDDIQPKGAESRGWVETGRIDSRGHDLGIELARIIPDELRRVAALIERLLDSGWRQVRVVTDHGWLLLPGGLPKHELPGFVVESRWLRCAAIKGESRPDVPTVPWHWNHSENIAIAPGSHVFRNGETYAHGGVSPQECVLPVLRVTRSNQPALTTPRIAHVRWKRLRCTVELTGPTTGLRVDIREHAGDSASLVTGVKEVEPDGQASLLVKDEDQEGKNAAIVVLDASGTLVAKYDTRIGG